MTIVCALASKDGTRVAMASDRMMEDGNNEVTVSPQKWKKCGNLWIGLSGDSALLFCLDDYFGATLEESLDSPISAIGVIRRMMTDCNVRPDPDNAGCFHSNGIIVAPGKGMFQFFGNMVLEQIPCGTLAAIGSGCAHARGAAHALQESSWLADQREEDIVLAAARAACAFDSGCRPPIDVWAIDGQEVRYHECT